MTITLGDYGEGCCKICGFTQALLRNGLVAGHRRGLSIGASRDVCKGAYRKPAKAGITEIAGNAFTFEAPVATCPECRTDQKYDRSTGRFMYHLYGNGMCPGFYDTVHIPA